MTFQYYQSIFKITKIYDAIYSNTVIELKIV